MFGLPAGQVGGFQTARVVFIFRLAAFVRGLGVGGARGFFEHGQMLAQTGDDELEQLRFFHRFKGNGQRS